MDDMRRKYIKKKYTKLKKCESVSSGKISKLLTRSKTMSNPTFHIKLHLSTDSLLAKTKDIYLFGYVKGELDVPDELK